MRLIDAELTAKDIARCKVVALERGNDKMNKMMECYINPTAFLDGVTYGMGLAQKVVCGQPTANDIDKVVEQLEEMKAKPMELKYDVPLIEAIIEIVKKGGA